MADVYRKVFPEDLEEDVRIRFPDVSTQEQKIKRIGEIKEQLRQHSEGFREAQTTLHSLSVDSAQSGSLSPASTSLLLEQADTPKSHDNRIKELSAGLSALLAALWLTEKSAESTKKGTEEGTSKRTAIPDPIIKSVEELLLLGHLTWDDSMSWWSWQFRRSEKTGLYLLKEKSKENARESQRRAKASLQG